MQHIDKRVRCVLDPQSLFREAFPHELSDGSGSQASGPQARLAETQRRHALARSAWQPSSLPVWLHEETYTRKIQPLLAGIANPVIMSALGVSVTYAVAIRAGRRRPHPRHWEVLAGLVGIKD
jgi:hypothetical protein